MTEHEATTPELQSAEEQEPAEEEEQPASEHGSPASQKEGASPSPTASVESSTTPAMEREESSSSEIAPMQETTAEDLHNFCSTQACAQPTDIVDLAEKTLATLGNLWAEIGFESHERDNATSEMFAEVKRVFATRLSSTQETKCALSNKIRVAAARIGTIEQEVGAAHDASLERFSSSATLRERLLAHRTRLQTLEELKGERTGVLTGKSEELRVLFLDLDDALSDEQAKFLRVVCDYTPARVEAMSDRIKSCVEEKGTRGAHVAAHVETIKRLWDDISGEDLEDDLEDAEGVDAKIKADEAWKLTLANLSTLQGRIQALRDEKEARTLSRGALLNHMATLWERIKTPAEDRERFPLEHPGIAMRTLHTLEAEIARLQEVKIAMMKELVLDTRVSLTEVWTAMCMTDDATRNFSPAFTEVFTEEALHLHELHLAACKTKLEAMQPILKLVERREFIRTEEEAMKLAASDPNRLMGRGRGMAEQLKKEEKVRYMVQKEQPKLIEKLRATIAEFESSRAEHLTLNGSRLLDTLPEEEVFKKPALPGSKPAVPSGFAAPKRTAEKEKARPSSATPVSRTKAAPDSENNRPQSARAAGKFRAAAKEIGRLPMASLNAADAPDQAANKSATKADEAPHKSAMGAGASAGSAPAKSGFGFGGAQKKAVIAKRTITPKPAAEAPPA